MNHLRFLPHLPALAALLLSGAPLSADWPAYRADAARSGYTPRALAAGLGLAWERETGKPEPAWPRSERLAFDRASAGVVSEGRLFFGSTRDHALHIVDAATGEGGPVFITEGPIRFAPALWRDRVFVASDDGFLYCLSRDGELIWKHRGGPGDTRRLGNEKLVSKWPARGAPVIVGDTVYYAAGIWPSDEIFLHALDCATGETRWVNDDSGGMYMPQPHGGADAESGVAAQGYLVVAGADASNAPFPPPGIAATKDEQQAPQLLVPTGRAVPAAFDLQTGAFQYFHLQQNGKRGGFATMAVGPMFFNSGIAFDSASGQAGDNLGAGPVAAHPLGVVRAGGGKVESSHWVSSEKPDRRGQARRVWELAERWSTPIDASPGALIIAGDTVVIGADGAVFLLDLGSGKLLQRFEVDGAVHDLAAADGRLFASTDSGRWYGFAPGADAPKRHALAVDDAGWPVDPLAVAAAEEILSDPARRAGYCLDFGCGDGQLARELARRSELRIYAVDDDAARVQQTRQKLMAAGLYGTRVTVHHIAELAALPYPRYFANLVVSGRGLSEPDAAFLQTGWQECLRPYGGLALLGAPGALRLTERGPLKGAGEWTHQYASAANQVCSTDEHAQGPLGMLWYRDVDLDLPQRHGRGPAPLFFDGLLYHLGTDELVCVDAYNGTERWRHSLPGILKAYDGDELMGVSGTGGNYCVGESGLFVRREGYCLRLDRRTGELLGRFEAPKQRDGKPGTWGYIALDDGLLFGSLANPEHQVTFRWRESTGDMSQQLTESSSLFALDPLSGDLLWRYDAEHSIRHNAIAAGDGQVFLIDRPLALADRRREAPTEARPGGSLVALDARSGEEKWRAAEPVDGTTLSLSPEYKRLLVSFQPTRFALASEAGTKLAVFATDQGELLWEKDVKYASRPMINDYTVYAQGGAWDLLSGEERPFNFSRSYGCGILAGSRHLMVFRSATLGYFDLTKNERTENYGGVRPGCWLNALPAGGLVLVPDASAGCTCSYLNQSWMALEPLSPRPPESNPPGGHFRNPVSLELRHHNDAPGSVIRYTLDGRPPTAESPVYQAPLTLDSSARLRSRVFTAGGQVSRSLDTEFVIDPHRLPLADGHWRVWDVPGNPSGAPSRWFVEGDVIRQTSNIYLGSASEAAPEVERYGTLRIFEDGADFQDGVIEFEFRSGDDDGLGIAFRFIDEQRHYLWATDLQRRFRILARKDGDTFEMLAGNTKSYQKNVWQRVRVTLDGPRLSIAVDDEDDMSVTDDRFQRGTLALHCWGSNQVEFRNLSFRPLQSPSQ
jgi:outer membrane protein assembly factor BamB